ncbi:hypothetical protein F2P79_018176 [Pimephales promelas]|nr:hypothetical protein F2P79_018176 [Pimephales promelas]
MDRFPKPVTVEIREWILFFEPRLCQGEETGSKDAGDQLLSVRQGRNMAAEKALSFHKLAAQTVWLDDTLKLSFYKCLNLDMN